ncbi:hypothetical protein ACFQE5_09695 [Pseudonocardia hispaniensis]|uniref:Uncharacterized protein n=1 Tax=Pseudonocardia hispaniensis TaxID=904933 RepID=A0ABW1J1I1_9PSEU
MRAVVVCDVEGGSFATHRGEGISFQRLLKGEEGAPDNFELSLVHIDERYRTPRHHHNFDQIHYVLEGLHQYTRDTTVPSGTVTYLPEGTYYGPQVGQGGVILVVQMGGSTGSGFMSYDQLAVGNRALAERGRFENGIFRWVDDEGRHRNQDGYEAIWEHVNGKSVDYPKPRYTHPISMRPENFTWVPAESEPGVEHKHIATFGERRTAVGFTRIATGVTHQVPERNGVLLHFVMNGAVRCADTTYGSYTAIRIDDREGVTYRATADTELFTIGLPVFASADVATERTEEP